MRYTFRRGRAPARPANGANGTTVQWYNGANGAMVGGTRRGASPTTHKFEIPRMNNKKGSHGKYPLTAFHFAPKSGDISKSLIFNHSIMIKLTSVLRFKMRPASVSLEAIWLSMPLPTTTILLGLMPLNCIWRATSLARS